MGCLISMRATHRLPNMSCTITLNNGKLRKDFKPSTVAYEDMPRISAVLAGS